MTADSAVRLDGQLESQFGVFTITSSAKLDDVRHGDQHVSREVGVCHLCRLGAYEHLSEDLKEDMRSSIIVDVRRRHFFRCLKRFWDQNSSFYFCCAYVITFWMENCHVSYLVITKQLENHQIHTHTHTLHSTDL